MIYDAIEQVATVLEANFQADLSALLLAKGVGGDDRLMLYKRQDAEAFFRYTADSFTGVGLGIYPRHVVTQAKYQALRHSMVDVVFDYYCRGDNPVVLQQQTELAAEAILRTIDRVASAGSGIYGAGAMERSVTIDFPTEPFAEIPEGQYEARCIVVAPIHDSDTI